MARKSMSNIRKKNMSKKRQVGADGMTAEQRKWQEENLRAHDARKRMMCNTFRLWEVCDAPACRRAHSCVGDMHACFERQWAAIPEEEKAWLRAGIKARAAGLSSAEAARAADAEVARHNELMASLNARVSRGAVASPISDAASQQGNEPPAPRIRLP
jgi:hypothetical protein